MDIVITTVAALAVAVLINFFYWRPRFREAKAEFQTFTKSTLDEFEVTKRELSNYKKSLFRAVDIHGQLKAENIMLKEKIEAEKQWKNFLMQES